MVRKLVICVLKNRCKSKPFFWDKKFQKKAWARWSQSNGQRQHRRRVDRRPNFRPRVKARVIKDGGRLLGFYISEADEENRGVGFVNHQSTEKLWRCVDRRTPRVAARVGEDGVQTLGFCISEAKEKICGIGFAKWLRKNNRSEGRLGLDDATAVAFDSGEEALWRWWRQQ